MKTFSISAATFFCLFLFFASGAVSDQNPQEKTLLKVLDINVWSGLDYIGTLTMGEYESAAVREKRFQALVQQIKVMESRVVMKNIIDGVHASDHYGIYSELLINSL